MIFSELLPVQVVLLILQEYCDSNNASNADYYIEWSI